MERGGQAVFCAVCGHRIGVYEPVVVRTAEGARRTSLTLEPELRYGGAIVVHAACADLAEQDPSLLER
jgi:hypothetical protein